MLRMAAAFFCCMAATSAIMDSRLPLCFCGAVTLSPACSERAAREITVLNVAKFQNFVTYWKLAQQIKPFAKFCDVNR
jgi:hypothetical protein